MRTSRRLIRAALGAALVTFGLATTAWALPGFEASRGEALAPGRASPPPEDLPRLADDFRERPMPSAQAIAMDALVDEFLRVTEVHALDAFVLHEDGRAWSKRVLSGSAAPSAEERPPSAESAAESESPPSAEDAPLFYWASVGKTWVAIAALQLVEEGALSLDARLSTWDADFPGAEAIRVEHLLRHTSGLYSFQEDPELRARRGYKAPAELLAAARARPLSFCPGTGWAYSNTGYMLLGQILEAIDGRPLSAILQSRIADRLGLRDVRVLGPDSRTDDLAQPRPSAPSGGTADDLRTPGAAGPVAASAADMARFWLASFSDRLLGPRMRRLRFESLQPGLGQFFGLGAMVYDLPASPNTPPDVWLGHSGGLPGAKAVVVWSTRQRAVAAVALTGEAPPEALANRLLALLEGDRTSSAASSPPSENTR
jgi:D-alanyl-D-alanine carboxypeptidase